MPKDVIKILPPEWVDRIEKDLEQSNTRVIPAMLAAKFKEYDAMVMASAISKKEYEGMMFLNLFVIWKTKMWRAKHDSWEEYLDVIEDQPYGPSKSDVKHKVSDIAKLWHEGISPKSIIKAIGAHPQATHALLELPEDKRDGTISDIIDRKFDETTSPRASARMIRDMSGQPTIYCDQGIYDTVNEQYLFVVIIDPPVGEKVDKDFTIKDVTPEVAEWLNRKLQPHQRIEK